MRAPNRPASPRAVALEIEHSNTTPRRGKKDRSGQEQRQPKRAIFTMFTATACVGIFIWEIYLNNWKLEPPEINPLFGPSQETLLHAGAKRTDLIVNKGEWWRLFVPVYLHGGIIHLVVNLVGLCQLGSNLEGFYGTLRVALLYIFAGISGNIVSALFLPASLTVGASGAIFGLLGGAWADLIQNWSHTVNPCCQMIGLLFTTALNVVMGLMPFLDNFCHLGGMVSGFFLGLVLFVQQDKESGRQSRCQYTCAHSGLVISIVSTLVFLGLLYTGVDGSKFCPSCEALNCFPIEGLWSCNIVIGCNVKQPDGFSLELPYGAENTFLPFNTTGNVQCSQSVSFGEVTRDAGKVKVSIEKMDSCPTETSSSDAMCLFRTASKDKDQVTSPICYRCVGKLSEEEKAVGFQCKCQVNACLVCDAEEVP